MAVIYHINPLLLDDDHAAKKCGHECSLPHLVSDVHDANAGSTHICPVCLQSKVAVVCDGNADRILCNNGQGNQHPVVTFRYGPVHYFLSLKSYSSRFTAASSAISRIGLVLGVDAKQGMKIIYKGKVIYPDKTNDVSEEIISISSADISQKRKKPSLVVMGVRTRSLNSNAAEGLNGFVRIALVSLSSPRTLWSYMTWGLLWTLNMTKSLVTGVSIFVQSMLYPPEHRAGR